MPIFQVKPASRNLIDEIQMNFSEITNFAKASHHCIILASVVPVHTFQTSPEVRMVHTIRCFETVIPSRFVNRELRDLGFYLHNYVRAGLAQRPCFVSKTIARTNVFSMKR